MGPSPNRTSQSDIRVIFCSLYSYVHHVHRVEDSNTRAKIIKGREPLSSICLQKKNRDGDTQGSITVSMQCERLICQGNQGNIEERKGFEPTKRGLRNQSGNGGGRELVKCANKGLRPTNPLPSTLSSSSFLVTFININPRIRS